MRSSASSSILADATTLAALDRSVGLAPGIARPAGDAAAANDDVILRRGGVGDQQHRQGTEQDFTLHIIISLWAAGEPPNFRYFLAVA